MSTGHLDQNGGQVKIGSKSFIYLTVAPLVPKTVIVNLTSNCNFSTIIIFVVKKIDFHEIQPFFIMHFNQHF